MADGSDALAALAPGFLAERERRLDAMEGAVRALGAAETLNARAHAAEGFARNAHSLKGAAQIEGRQVLCDITALLETRVTELGARPAVAGADVAMLLRAIKGLRQISRGRAPGDAERRLMVGLRVSS